MTESDRDASWIEARAALLGPIDVAAMPLGAWVAIVVERRGRQGVRNARPGQGEPSTVRRHIAGDATLAPLPVGRVTSRDVRAWIDRIAERGLAHRTLKNALSILRCALQAAVDDGAIERNVAREVRVPRARGTRSTSAHGFDGVLSPAEQEALARELGAAEPSTRALVLVALGTGIRRGELLALERSDVVIDGAEPAIVVRYGSRRAGAGEQTKGGRVRRLPLFGMALDALRSYVAQEPESLGSPLMFPGPLRGGRTKVPALAPWLERAGVARRVRWHDLRHTAGTSLLQGWWGRRWSVAEVQALLGHSSPAITGRYLHVRNDTLFTAARETSQARDVKETWPEDTNESLLPSDDAHGAQLPLFSSSHPGELNPRAPRR